MVDYKVIPQWLRQPKTKIYCCHKDKVPTHGTKPNDLGTFFSFDDALAIMEPDEGLGIGMWGYLCGIDIDHCITDGVISSAAQAIIDRFPNAYVERSLSGTGIHILFLSKEQYVDKDTYYVKMGKKHMKEKGITGIEGLEFYQGLYDHRYLTLSADVISSSDIRPEFTGDDIKKFLDDYFTRPVVATVTPVSFTSSDDEDKAWIKWALLVKRPQKLLEFWDKTPTGSGGTESEDDLAFMSELAFWCNRNPVVMRAVFESSRYYKKKDAKHIKKWARKDYSEGVIKKAMSNGNVAKVHYENKYIYKDNIIKEVNYVK